MAGYVVCSSSGRGLSRSLYLVCSSSGRGLSRRLYLFYYVALAIIFHFTLHIHVIRIEAERL
jgi:hypothetical protein